MEYISNTDSICLSLQNNLSGFAVEVGDQLVYLPNLTKVTKTLSLDMKSEGEAQEVKRNNKAAEK